MAQTKMSVLLLITQHQLKTSIEINCTEESECSQV